MIVLTSVVDWVDRFHMFTNLIRTMSTAITKKGVTYNKETGEIFSCLFCRIQKRIEPGTIEYEDDNYVVFRTIIPMTSYHVLVTPREHIKNLKEIPKNLEGAKLLYRLKQIGIKTLLKEFNNDMKVAESAQYCFHVPPYNSIDHLHLHAIAYPETISFINSWKYPSTDTIYCAHVDTLIQQYSNEFYKDLDEKGNLFNSEYNPDR